MRDREEKRETQLNTIPLIFRFSSAGQELPQTSNIILHVGAHYAQNAITRAMGEKRCLHVRGMKNSMLLVQCVRYVRTQFYWFSSWLFVSHTGCWCCWYRCVVYQQRQPAWLTVSIADVVLFFCFFFCSFSQPSVNNQIVFLQDVSSSSPHRWAIVGGDCHTSLEADVVF